jgi:transcriptional regulator with XRE-family HTH domain
MVFEAYIDLTYMGGIERGKRIPSLLVMARIADALGVQLLKLINCDCPLSTYYGLKRAFVSCYSFSKIAKTRQ